MGRSGRFRFRLGEGGQQAANIFWGKTDSEGQVIEHYGRRCQGILGMEGEMEGEKPQQCDYRFRFKECPHCGAENDIAARDCHQCGEAVVDPDDLLKRALQLKDAMVIRCAGVTFANNEGRLRITYHDEQGEELHESFDLSHSGQRNVFNRLFGRRFNAGTEPKRFNTIDEVIAHSAGFQAPDFIVARRHKHHWRVRERLFDYDGRYRKANQL